MFGSSWSPDSGTPLGGGSWSQSPGSSLKLKVYTVIFSPPAWVPWVSRSKLWDLVLWVFYCSVDVQQKLKSHKLLIIGIPFYPAILSVTSFQPSLSHLLPSMIRQSRRLWKETPTAFTIPVTLPVNFHLRCLPINTGWEVRQSEKKENILQCNSRVQVLQ